MKIFWPVALLLIGAACGGGAVWVLRPWPTAPRAGEPAPAAAAPLTAGTLALAPPDLRADLPGWLERTTANLALTDAELATPDDGELGTLAMNRVNLPTGSWALTRELADRLPRPWRAVYHVFCLGGVYNGGLRTYFEADGPWQPLTGPTLDDLEYLGMGDHRRVLAEALGRRIGQAKPYGEYGDLDEQFFRLPSTAALVGRYVRSQPEFFRAAAR
jgi:hypothetical protein